ncbi:hypothetical protein LUX29_00120 [Aureimonas altamirensis]|uniref:hypothetical protein n=1 Tax=Aureimonas altamirensis TaxID=370622 RepID=UPI001E459245|nr:hypothetical protein [Aureimonas altamirensis]UHD45715.1 hypothetical protein LUX29_00120 [Aureimonas altamirensis]
MVENAEVGGPPGRISSFADRCAREPIHIPGSIQPHGFLLVVDGASQAVVAASANAGTHLRIEGAVIGKRLAEIGLARAAGNRGARVAPQGQEQPVHRPVRH